MIGHICETIVNQMEKNLETRVPEGKRRDDAFMLIMLVSLEDCKFPRQMRPVNVAAHHKDILGISNLSQREHRMCRMRWESTFPSSTLKWPKDGTSSNRAGNVIESLPEGFTLPNSMSAMASPVALPRYHA